MVTEDMIHRAAHALCYESEAEVAARFVAEGIPSEIAFLAVVAGKLYGRSR